jgi:hypothetical protein
VLSGQNGNCGDYFLKPVVMARTVRINPPFVSKVHWFE